MTAKMNSNRYFYSADQGFTVFEVIMVMILIGLLASIFAETIVSSMDIYADQNNRSNVSVDVRRSSESIWHELKEWTDWQTSPTNTRLEFNKYNLFEHTNGTLYYAKLRQAYSHSSESIYYQRDESGQWANLYPMILGGVSTSPSLFSETTLGGTRRITVNLALTVDNKPMRLQFSVFPRSEGG